MALSRLLARPLLASYFLANGVSDLRNTPALAKQAAPVTDRIAPLVDDATPAGVSVPQDPATWVRISGAVQIAAGLALATGRFPRLSSAVLGATLVPSTAARHRFWEASDADERREQLVHFTKNAALAGGLVIAALDTEGRPGVLWKTKHGAQAAGAAVTGAAHVATSGAAKGVHKLSPSGGGEDRAAQVKGAAATAAKHAAVAAAIAGQQASVAAKKVSEKAAETAPVVAEHVAQAGQRGAEHASRIAEQVAARASEQAPVVADHVTRVAHAASDQAARVAHEASARAPQVAQAAQDAAQQARRSAVEAGAKVRDRVR